MSDFASSPSSGQDMIEWEIRLEVLAKKMFGEALLEFNKWVELTDDVSAAKQVAIESFLRGLDMFETHASKVLSDDDRLSSPVRDILDEVDEESAAETGEEKEEALTVPIARRKKRPLVFSSSPAGASSEGGSEPTRKKVCVVDVEASEVEGENSTSEGNEGEEESSADEGKMVTRVPVSIVQVVPTNRHEIRLAKALYKRNRRRGIL
ncbi:hypothetical protein P691DRAFT_768462 [Macrolepiota fuliginosa MF-IS2]|uniref:Uncharacterized protein n=1 Tax=Macrolepiota fuliginosa MF-IS2 TaxID=1400762 RepID=A0A9P5WX95_9AGAR|nr:hypothetical protein P691DRAFT_768462 [Macrolepiota fuliginosa MF-IS2]